MPHGCVLFAWLGDWAERLQGFPYSFSFVNIKRSSPPVGAKGNCRELVTTKQPAISKDCRLRNCALDHADYDTNQHCYFFCADFYLKIFDCHFHNVLLF